MEPGGSSIYEAAGGAETFRRLVEAFYPKVQQDPDLAPLFPDDITPVMEKQYLFLSQFFGGPPLYSEQYGQPMMRARHLPFPVTPGRAAAWLGCMERALAEIGLNPALQELMLDRLRGPAAHFINSDDEA